MLALLAIALAGCVGMALMLQYALRAQSEHRRSGPVRQIEEAHGDLLQGLVRLQVTGSEAPDDELVATVTVIPKPGCGSVRLAQGIGQTVWRSLGAERVLDRVEVVFEPAGERIRVAAPYFGSRKTGGEGAAPASGPEDGSVPPPADPAGGPAPDPARPPGSG